MIFFFTSGLSLSARESQSGKQGVPWRIFFPGEMKLTNFIADPSMPIAFDTESLGFL